MAYYGTLNEANAYFAQRLYADAWDSASGAQRENALIQATRLIDGLNYKGVKSTVYDIMYDSDGTRYISTDAPTEDEIIVADRAQELEFPRGKDTEVPDQIEWACYETAYALLEGFDPDTALESLRVIRQSYSAVGTTYANDDLSMEHLLYGIPTGTVWRWLVPYLVDNRSVRLRRVN